MTFQTVASDWEISPVASATGGVPTTPLAVGVNCYLLRSRHANCFFRAVFAGFGVGAGILPGLKGKLPAAAVAASRANWNRLIVGRPFSGSEIHGYLGEIDSAAFGVGSGIVATYLRCGPPTLFSYGSINTRQSGVVGASASVRKGTWFTLAN